MQVQDGKRLPINRRLTKRVNQMTKNAPATQLPWHLGLRQAEQIVYDSKGWAVANATVYHGKADLAETKANAAYIAKACNAYPQLVEVLQGLFEQCAMVHKYWGDGCNQKQADEVQKRALVLLAELGEQS